MKRLLEKVITWIRTWLESHEELIDNVINASRRLLRFVFRLVLALSVAISFLGFVIIPFLDSYISDWKAVCVWCLFAIVVIFCDVRNTKMPNREMRSSDDITTMEGLSDMFATGGSFLLCSIFGSALIINYFDTQYNWWWAAAVIVFVADILVASKFHQIARIFVPLDKQQVAKVRWAVFKTAIFYLLLDCFYVSAFNKWTFSFFVFGVLALVIQLSSVARTFLAEKFKFKGLLIHDFIAGILLTIYLIYEIPNEQLQEIVLAIVSAVYGGFIALVGVAWTIKDGQRREAESKRLEKMPYLKAEFGEWVTSDKRGHDVLFDRLLDIESSNVENQVSGGHSIHVTNIGLGMATNIFYRWKDDTYTDPNRYSSRLLRCDDSYSENIIFSASREKSESRVVQKQLLFEFDDLLGNHYSQNMIIGFEIHRSYIKILSVEMDAPEFCDEV